MVSRSSPFADWSRSAGTTCGTIPVSAGRNSAVAIPLIAASAISNGSRPASRRKSVARVAKLTPATNSAVTITR